MPVFGRWRRIYDRQRNPLGWIKAALPMACCLLCRAIVPATRLRTHYDRKDCLDGRRFKRPWCIEHRVEMAGVKSVILGITIGASFRCYACQAVAIRHANFLAIEKGRSEALTILDPRRSPFWQPGNRNPVVPLYVGGKARTVRLEAIPNEPDDPETTTHP